MDPASDPFSCVEKRGPPIGPCITLQMDGRKAVGRALVITFWACALTAASAQPGNPLGGTSGSDGEPCCCRAPHGKQHTLAAPLPPGVKLAADTPWLLCAGGSLQKLQQALGSPGVLASWLNGDPCTSNWTGVACSAVNGAQRVTSL